MNRHTGFSAIAGWHATILILGSMPSEASLNKNEYYAHERNAFWPIMLALFDEHGSLGMNEYKLRKSMLIKNNIAVWDVLQSCYRAGSLDSAIKMDSIKVNGFNHFFSVHRKIIKVCFNGAKAESIFNKHVLPNIQQKFGAIQYCRLPSTSPAHATLSLQQKIDQWKNEIKSDKV